MKTSTEAFASARRIADAVMYEGYVLYPYRASAAKNQLRWQFGVLAPRPLCERDSSEHWFSQTECIVEGGPGTRLDIRVRCLQAKARTNNGATWDEAVEHEIDVPGVDGVFPFTLPASSQQSESITRECLAVYGAVQVTSETLPGTHALTKLRVRVENVTNWTEPGASRAQVLRRSFLSVHVLLHVGGGAFVSPVDPPAYAEAAVASCVNEHTWPVLTGPVGDRTTVLSSPIILSDHPEVAPESPGDMCDGTEIDEILALRVLTLTDDEKREARLTDPRAAAIVDRVAELPAEVFARLHGAIRAPAPPGEQPWWDPAVDAAVDPWTDTIQIAGADVRKGTKVALRPGRAAGRRADAQDIFLDGRIGTVEGVFHDVDGDQHVAVVLDDDPAADLHQSHGRFLYFHPDEVEPLR